MVERDRVSQHGYVSTFLVLSAVLIAVVDAPLSAAAQYYLKNAYNEVTCVVAVASQPARPGDRIAFDIRLPLTPDSTLLSRLPVSKRDYSSLPVQVYLLAAPAKGQQVTGNVGPIKPVASDLSPRRFGLSTDVNKDQFVRVEFPRNTVRAGMDVVAEKTSVTDGGEKISTQTRCRITAAEVAVWK